MSYTIKEKHGKYNRSKRTSSVKYIVVHYTGSGTSRSGSAKANCIYFGNGNRKASAHYFIDDANIYEYADPKLYYTWHCGDGHGKYGITNANSIGIEVCLNGDKPFTNKEIARLEWLVKKLRKQFDISNKNVIRHYDASRKLCPYYYAKRNSEWNKLHGKLVKKASTKLTAADLKNKSDKEIVALVGPLCTEDQKKTGILASVTMAQFILESAYGKSELAQKANNFFGMKKNLSGNNWIGSTWDGKSVYSKKTGEEYNGKKVKIVADFRKYTCIADSIADHSAYLLGAMNGKEKRYGGLKGCTDYKKAITIIKNGGYATSSDYVKNICNVIEKWNLTKYDVKPSSSASEGWKVQVTAKTLYVRTGPAKTYKNVGTVRKNEVFSILEEKNGWGRLKSGAGWIYLGFTKKL